MIGHQDIGVDSASMLHRRLPRPTQVTEVIVIVQEHGMPVVASLHDVDRDTWKEEAPLAMHANAPLGRGDIDQCIADTLKGSDRFFAFSGVIASVPHRPTGESP